MKIVHRIALLSFLSALILLSGASCGLLGSRQAWQPPRPVAIKGGTSETVCFNLFPSYITWMTTVPEGGTGGLLVRDGDIIAGGSSLSFFVYKQSDGASLEMGEEDGRLILSGKTVSVAPAGIPGCWEWLDRASSDDLRSLRFLMLPKDMDESRLPTLRKLAALNPDLNLGIESISSSRSAAALFKPRMLIQLGVDATAAELGGFLVGQKQIETLFIVNSDAENLDSLAALPHLRRLAIFDWDPAKTGPLPKGMRALKSLMLWSSSGSVPLDASALAEVPGGIEELSLTGYQVTNMSGLERFSNLRTLILHVGGGIEDLSALRGMKRLAWVGLPPGITQEQFSAFIGEHPTMKIVELIGCSEIIDLSPLQRLTGLTGLVVKEFSGRLDAVYQLKSLEFLALPSDVFTNDTKRLERIREELPRALVVSVWCLGSGWILLVLPLGALMWIAGSRARRRRRTSP